MNHLQSRSHQVVLATDGIDGISCAEEDGTALPRGDLSTGAVPYQTAHTVGKVISTFCPPDLVDALTAHSILACRCEGHWWYELGGKIKVHLS